MYLSLNDGSNGLSEECHLVVNVLNCILPCILAADKSALTKENHSCSSSSVPWDIEDWFREYDEAVSIHESSHARI